MWMISHLAPLVVPSQREEQDTTYQSLWLGSQQWEIFAFVLSQTNETIPMQVQTFSWFRTKFSFKIPLSVHSCNTPLKNSFLAIYWAWPFSQSPASVCQSLIANTSSWMCMQPAVDGSMRIRTPYKPQSFSSNHLSLLRTATTHTKVSQNKWWFVVWT